MITPSVSKKVEIQIVLDHDVFLFFLFQSLFLLCLQHKGRFPLSPFGWIEHLLLFFFCFVLFCFVFLFLLFLFSFRLSLNYNSSDYYYYCYIYYCY